TGFAILRIKKGKKVDFIQRAKRIDRGGDGLPFADDLAAESLNVGFVKQTKHALSVSQQPGVFLEQSPVRTSVGSRPPTKIRGIECAVFVIGAGLGVVDNAAASARQPSAEFGILCNAKLGIEIASRKHEVSTDAQIAGNEIGLVQRLPRAQVCLR